LAKIDPAILINNTTEFHIFKNKYLNRIAYEIIQLAALSRALFIDGEGIWFLRDLAGTWSTGAGEFGYQI